MTLRNAGFVLSRLLRFKGVQDIEASYNQETEPDLATSAETPDGVIWTAKLRPNAMLDASLSNSCPR